MPRDLFGDVVHPGPGLGPPARSAVPLSLIGHAVFAAVVIIVPLMATEEVPRPYRGEIAHVPVAPRPPQLPPAAMKATTAVRSNGAPSVDSSPAPTTAPTGLAPEAPTTRSIGPGAGPVAGFDPGTFTGSSVPVGVPEAPPAHPQKPVPAGGVIKTPVKIRHVPPVYPPIAQQARVEGVVIIEAIVGVDGRVLEARVLRSKPLLDEAALAAVRQWEFTPTTLNGVPVPVIMTVTVNFTLR